MEIFLYKAEKSVVLSASTTHVLVDESVEFIPDGVFSHCNSLISIIFPTGLETIGLRSFFQCKSLVELAIPSTLREICISAFSDCIHLKSIKAQEDFQLQTIGDGCFYHCKSLSSLSSFPSNVSYIGKGAFYQCYSLISIDLEKVRNLKRIEKNSFCSCTSLKHARLPSSIECVETCAFYQCYELLSIEFCSSARDNEMGVSHGNLVCVGDQAFRSCRSIRRISFPRSLQTIGVSAFESCHSMVSVELYIPTNDEDNTLVVIGENAFSCCKNLINISLPNSIRSIPDNVFSGCDKLTERCNGDTTLLLDTLTKRFNGLPLHKICYNQVYHDIDETLEKATFAILSETLYSLQSCDSTQQHSPPQSLKIDSFGLTPLHILAMGSSPYPTLCQLLISYYEEHNTETPPLLAKDVWENIPLYYSCLSNAPIETVNNLLDWYNYSGITFNDKEWWLFIDSALSNAIDLVQVLVKASINDRLEYIGYEKWKKDILKMLASIPHKHDASERRRHIWSLQSKLESYERKEVFSLIRQSLWKAKIDQLALESHRFDKVIRLGCLIHCGDDVIITNIIPFLGG